MGNADVTVRVCGPEDRADQAALFDLCFEKSDGERVVPWRYDGNPHGRAIALLATAPDGTHLSGYACSPRVVLSGEDGAEAVVGQTGDVMTHPERRGQGIFSDLDRRALQEARESGWPAVFGLPNRLSAPIFVEKLGWRSVGQVRPWTFVLHADAGARTERLRAGRLASAAVPWAYFRGIRRRARLRDRAFDKVNGVPIPRFDAEVDELTRAVAKRWPWMVRRDHAYLNWRFLEAPSGLFRAHGAFDAEGALRGYCIVQVPDRGENVGWLVDVVGLDDVAVAGVIETGLRHLHKAGASVARAHAIRGSWWERWLRRAGFRAPKRGDHKIVIVHVLDEGHALAKVAADPSRWYFTDGDRDDELVR